MEISKDMREIVDKIILKYSHLMGENDTDFFKRVYLTPSETYSQRLNAIKFTGKDKVLDAGCGFGQWSIELAKINRFVYAIDLQPQRLFVLNEILENLGIKNLVLQQGQLENLPYPDETFDAIFCYGVIFCTGWKETLQEFVRVLKNQGVIYLTANGLGWYIHLWKHLPNAADDYNPREVAAQSFWNTIEYEKFNKAPETGGVIIDFEQMVTELEKYGLKIIAKGGDGTINLNPGSPSPKSFFQECYESQLGCYELLVKKSV